MCRTPRATARDTARHKTRHGRDMHSTRRTRGGDTMRVHRTGALCTRSPILLSFSKENDEFQGGNNERSWGGRAPTRGGRRPSWRWGTCSSICPARGEGGCGMVGVQLRGMKRAKHKHHLFVCSSPAPSSPRSTDGSTRHLYRREREKEKGRERVSERAREREKGEGG